MFTIDFSLQFHLKSKIPSHQWECGVNVFIAGVTRIKHLDITSKKKKKNHYHFDISKSKFSGKIYLLKEVKVLLFRMKTL